MNSRLLFAAARGARIQVMANDYWYGVDTYYLRSERRKLRIHPADEALQYGPISSALREMAANPSYELARTDEFGTWSLLYSDWCKCRDSTSELDVSLFLLLLAEALADEGL